MSNNDNVTAYPANEFDHKVFQTIPYYELFYNETINLVNTIFEQPSEWLDTGGGTGTLIVKAAMMFANTHFVLADPSVKMLEVAQGKISTSHCDYIQAGTQNISLDSERFDVISSIQSHHYFDVPTRKVAIENCFRLLKKGGLFISFENIKPLTNVGTEIGLKRWGNFQMEKGRSKEETAEHLGRFGKEFFPITMLEHLELLKLTGFETVEIFWLSYMQAGFYGIKG